MKTMRTWLTTIAALLCSITASAHDFTVNNIYYNITSEEELTVEVTFRNNHKYTGVVIIPSSATYNGTTYSVTSIRNSAFSGCDSFTSITIPESVTSIGNYAFSGCISLKEVIIEDGSDTLTLGYNYCSPVSTKEGQGIFYDCPLEEVYLGRNLSYNAGYKYGSSPFSDKSTLTSLVIGDSVTSIGKYAFSGCDSLTSITIPESVTSIGNSAFYNCSSLTSITIPESVTSIGHYAFSGCDSLTSITIPEGVTSIGNYAFSRCISLKEVIIEDGSDTLTLGCNSPYNSSSDKGKGLFYDCPLEEVYLGRNLNYGAGKAYGYSPFSDKSTLTSLIIGNSVTSIEDCAFHGCSSLTSITIPEGVTNIGNSAFYGCSSLTSITIPEGVTSIKDGTFGVCSSLTSITIPEAVTSIGKIAFSNCSSLTSIAIPEGVTNIGNSAFEGCSSLTSITIPESVTGIGERAFQLCCSLASITIPEGVTGIGEYAFSGCSSLISIFCLGIIPPTIAKSTFGRDAYNFADLFVPQGTKDAYQAATGWKEFLTIKEFDPTGIDQLTIDKSQLTIYDLKGRKVTDTENLKGGIYIVNGKKIVIE